MTYRPKQIFLLFIALLPIVATAEPPAPPLVIEAYHEQMQPSFSSYEHSLPYSCDEQCKIFIGAFTERAKNEVLVLRPTDAQLYHWEGSQLRPGRKMAINFTSTIELSALGDFDNDGIDEIAAIPAKSGQINILKASISSITQLATTGEIEIDDQTRIAAHQELLGQPAYLKVFRNSVPAQAQFYSLNPKYHWEHNSTLSYNIGGFDEIYFGTPVTRMKPGLFFFHRAVNLFLESATYALLHEVGVYPALELQHYKNPQVIGAGDFNGDGFIDVLVHPIPGISSSLLAGGERGVVEVSLAPLPAPDGHSIVGDINNDGLDDVLSLSRKDPSQLTVFVAQRGESVINHQLGDVDELYKRLLALTPWHDQKVEFKDWFAARYSSDTHTAIPAQWQQTDSGLRLRVVFHKNIPDSGTYAHPGGGLARRAPGPYTCTGFYSRSIKSYGRIQQCPENHYIVATDDPSARSKTIVRDIYVNCCPLPRDDIIDTAQGAVSAEEVCPSDHFTVAVLPPSDGLGSSNHRLVCRKINTEKYAIAEMHSARYWGVGLGGDRSARKVDTRQLPHAAQLGVRRTARDTLDIDGCVGSPIGSLLLGTGSGSTCDATSFGVLIEREHNQPLKMFPDCRRLLKGDSGFPECITQETLDDIYQVRELATTSQ